MTLLRMLLNVNIFLHYKALFQKQWYFMFQTMNKYILNIQEDNDIILPLSSGTKLNCLVCLCEQRRVVAFVDRHNMERGSFFKFAQICLLSVDVNPKLMDI